jgi:lysophospholipase
LADGSDAAGARAAPLGPGSTTRALRASDGIALRLALRAGGTRGLALVLPGRTEFAEKYAPVAEALAARGFDVAVPDWRGQGGSARLLGDPRRGHVGDFAEYQRDLAAVLAETGRPRLMLSHSMGGTIALRALLSGAAAPAASVFSAPMWALVLGPAKRAAALALARAATRTGLAARYVPGSGPENYAETDPEPNQLTACPEQAAWIAAVTRAHPGLAVGGPTLGWLDAALREMAALRPLSLAAPAAVIVGGEDRITARGAMAARARRDGLTLTQVPGGRHELMFETPPRRAAFWAAVDAELEARGV